MPSTDSIAESSYGSRWILVIADDLTGALEAGAGFASRGLAARVTCRRDHERPEAAVLVIDSETRHLSPGSAEFVVRDLAQRLRLHAPWLIYKKTDSTLRGNIAAELKALHDVFPERDMIYVPAYPAMGRTVREGHLLVHGVPVHQTSFAADPLNPVLESRVRAKIGDMRATVLNGECDEDVHCAARQIVGSDTPVTVAGPAAIGAALADCLAPECRSAISLPVLRRCLVVNGSLHPTSKSQMAAALAGGCFGGGWRVFEHKSDGTGLERARATSEAVKSFLSENPMDALVVFGGDTAFGIHHALGASDFEPYGEVLPGVPLSRSGELYWITKAGGFGGPDLLCELRKRLT